MSNKWRILVVDDESYNLQLMRQILQNDYELIFATSGIKALEAIQKKQPDIILLDIMMPEMDGYETCRMLKADPNTVKIPVIFVTAMTETEDESRGFEAGGVDYITKPISPPIVRARVETHLSLYDQQRACEKLIQQRTSELEASQKAAIFMLGEAGEYNDTETGLHIWRMASYSAAIARTAGWHVDDADMLELAAPMHDIGKIGIPDSILKKPAKLDQDEWKIMKSHSKIGHSILSKSNTRLFNIAADIALNHHEKWDGSGYPEGLTGENIPESARIIAIADVFDALTMERSYKKPWTVDEAFTEIRKNSGSHFDPRLSEIFFDVESDIRKIREQWNWNEKYKS